MKNSICLLCLLVLTSFYGLKAQFEVLDSVQIQANNLQVDELGQVYLVCGDRLELLQQDFAFKYKYSEQRISPQTQLDVTKSLKPLLFYPDYNSITLLDNTLSAQGPNTEIPWSEFGQVGAMCHSVGTHYWFFDTASMSLIRADYNLEVVYRTPDLSATLGVSLQPVQMIENNSDLFILDKEQGLYVFDFYGAFSHRIPIKGYSSFQIIGNSIYFFGNNKVLKYHRISKLETLLEIPFENVLAARIHKQVFFVLTEDAVIRVKYTQP